MRRSTFQLYRAVARGEMTPEQAEEALLEAEWKRLLNDALVEYALFGVAAAVLAVAVWAVMS